MTFEERVRLLKRLDVLIKRKYKGSATEYALKMEISRSAFFRLLDYIKNEFDAPIVYNKTSGHYEYRKKGVMFFGFLPVEFLTDEALKSTRGGTVKQNKIYAEFFHESQFTGLKANTFATRFPAGAEFNV